MPLPKYFTHGRQAKLTSMLDLLNFPSAIKEAEETNHFTILDELNQKKWYKTHVYSPEIIRYALLLRHTSLQAYRLIREEFPLPSISFFNRIQRGAVDAIKALKLLKDRGEMSKDLVMLVNEMIL